MKKHNQRLIELIANNVTIESRHIQLFEEIAELTQAICKLKRLNNQDETLAKELNAKLLQNNYIEELADVNIVVQELIYMAGEERVEAEMNHKLKRTIERMKLDKTR